MSAAVATKKSKAVKGKPEILFGDDIKVMRESIKDYLQEEELGFKVECPTSFSELENQLILRSFDGLMFDNSLDKWDLSQLNGKPIETGYDIAKFCQKINPIIPICVYSTKKEIPDDSSIIVIDKSHSNTEFKQIVKEFRPFTKPVHKAHKFFLRIQPQKTQETPESEINKYRLFLSIFKSWLDYGFEKLQNPDWIAICDRKIEMCGRFTPVKNKRLDGIEKVKVLDKYPATTDDLNDISLDSIYKPLVYWNAKNEKIVDNQFKLAGDNLKNIPKYLREYFSICMVPACVDLYLQDNYEKALENAEMLTPSSKVEFVKGVFKKLVSLQEREKFIRHCRESSLPVVVSVFRGRIDDIEKSSSGIKTAWVILEKVHFPKHAIAQPFDYSLLSKQGIRNENGLFEYVVFTFPPHITGYSIIPDYDIWSDFKI
jgi:hypothetical protein